MSNISDLSLPSPVPQPSQGAALDLSKPLSELKVDLSEILVNLRQSLKTGNGGAVALAYEDVVRCADRLEQAIQILDEVIIHESKVELRLFRYLKLQHSLTGLLRPYAEDGKPGEIEILQQNLVEGNPDLDPASSLGLKGAVNSAMTTYGIIEEHLENSFLAGRGFWEVAYRIHHKYIKTVGIEDWKYEWKSFRDWTTLSHIPSQKEAHSRLQDLQTGSVFSVASEGAGSEHQALTGGDTGRTPTSTAATSLHATWSNAEEDIQLSFGIPASSDRA
ncbi:hypothetical protein QFC19_000132 [Naganishia cerealis]|uniref:Uncharacterized protein n=2 Tax=Naganishia cerealis TaxID=610337 RepID=A0ACC2WT01_9TREE|nr:hypothetical protein QFC19_000131 [Naganishia cerealis]KAJ9113937.1 hypothetical protein QFC19_000132 [Naganishia cerealis]